MSGSGVNRRLAAILAADVVEYSRMMGADETGTLDRLLLLRKELVQPSITEHGGRIVKLMGDGLLAEFPSVVQAVASAVQIQDSMGDRDIDLPDRERIRLRIGVNLGDIIIKGSDIYGDGVNVAARLEGLAEPGSICISESVRVATGSSLSLDYEFLGERSMKNIEEPVRVYQLRPKADETRPERVTKSSDRIASTDPSIAILPFTNMSGDPEQEYFSDGITEDIITVLTRSTGLIVIPRNSVMLYKNKPVDVKQVGRELGVQFVLEGGVRKAGNHVRVSVQLVDAVTGQHRWVDRYDRSLDDIFAVQDDITHNIAIEMRVQLSLGEKARMLAGRTENAVAWEKQMLADELNNRFVRIENWKAQRLCEEALALDPEYVSAWTELGWTHMMNAMCGWTDSIANSLAETMATIDRALELEPDYPLALSLLGYVHLMRGEHDLAVQASEKSVTLAPDNTEGVAEFAHMLLFAGRAEEALVMINRAFRLCPTRIMWHLAILGQCQHLTGTPDLASETYRESVDKGPESIFPRMGLISALMEAGDPKEASAIARQVLQIEHDFSLSRWRCVEFRDQAVKNRIVNQLAQAGLPE